MKTMFFDIDGTLIDCVNGIMSIPQTTRNTLDQLKENGHEVFIATGRCPSFILDGVLDYPFSGFVTCNGAYVEYHGQVVYEECMDLTALKVLDSFCRERKIAYYMESNHDIYVFNKEHPVHLEFTQQWGMKEEIIVDDFDLSKVKVYICMIALNHQDEVAEMMATLSPYFSILPHHSGLSFDLISKDISKANGIEKLINHLNRDMKDTIAFGDGSNDVEMLQSVGYSIAMGNGCDEAKAVATMIGDTVVNDGITKACKKLKLI